MRFGCTDRQNAYANPAQRQQQRKQFGTREHVVNDDLLWFLVLAEQAAPVDAGVPLRRRRPRPSNAAAHLVWATHVAAWWRYGGNKFRGLIIFASLRLCCAVDWDGGQKMAGGRWRISMLTEILASRSIALAAAAA